MEPTKRWIGAIGLGAAGMYFLDPSAGRRRRAHVRDQAAHWSRESREFGGKAARDISNRTRGMTATAGSHARRWMGASPPADRKLEERAHTELGRWSSHPGAIHVSAQQGRLVLRGPILADEMEDVVAAVHRIPGVHEVENHLEPHQHAGEVPGLQQAGRRPEVRPDILQETWSPATRLLVGAAGGGMAAAGAARRGVTGSLLMSAGATALARSLTNRSLRDLAGLSEEHDAVRVQKTITVEAPVEEVYELWSHPEMFPRFMDHLRSVEPRGNDRYRWVAEGPAGLPAAWEAEVTEREPNRRVAWRSTAGSRIRNHGHVHFEGHDGGTRVHVQMGYTPPAGALGHAVARIFGCDPKHAMDDDLLRLKSLLENGKATAHGHQVTREELRATA
ncbi:MAG: SRPBCC family protein [Thermoanaerobaculia bacterium]